MTDNYLDRLSKTSEPEEVQPNVSDITDIPEEEDLDEDLEQLMNDIDEVDEHALDEEME